MGQSKYESAAAAARSAGTYAETDRHGRAWSQVDRARQLLVVCHRDLLVRLRSDGQSWRAISATVGVPTTTLHRLYGVADDGVGLVVGDDSEAWASVPAQRRSAAPAWMQEASW